MFWKRWCKKCGELHKEKTNSYFLSSQDKEFRCANIQKVGYDIYLRIFWNFHKSDFEKRVLNHIVLIMVNM